MARREPKLTRREVNAAALAGAVATAAATMASAAERQTIRLPPAQMQGGMPLLSALKLRRSTREYSDRALSEQTLSSLLWAGFGVNRPTGDRTAPYWRHIMVIDVYVAMADGVYLYDPSAHALSLHMPGDIRAQTGLQPFVAGAPVNLVYVAHGERMKEISPEDRRLYASVDAAFIGQNVYLYCASEGSRVRYFAARSTTRPSLGAMKLPEQQFVTFAQTVGYPSGG